MSDYLFFANIGDSISNYLEFSNFVQNRSERISSKIDFKIGIYIQRSGSTLWEKLDEIEFLTPNLVLDASKYSLKIGELAVVIPVEKNYKLLQSYKELPKPITRRLDHSVVNDRGALNFTVGSCFSSYQSEFPYAMSKLKGTFLAFDQLISKNVKHINKVVFINIFSGPLTKKEKFLLKVYDRNKKEELVKLNYEHNSATIIDIGPVCDKDLIFYSKDTLGIPIFLTYDKSNTFLSVEHTHPPSEFFFVNKFLGQSILKSNWLKVLP